MKPVYAIFLDIDGTLTWAKPVTSERNAAVLRRAQAEGHLVCLNSGRSKGNLLPELLAQLPWDGVIAGGGAYVSLHGSLLYREEVPAPLVTEICHAFLAEQICCVMEAEELNALVNPDIYPQYPGFPIRTREEAARFAEDYHTTKLTLLAVRQEIPKRLIGLLEPHFRVIYHPNYTECILKQCDKARGMEILLNAAGIPQAYSIALGDSLNDEEMLRYAGFSIAMGNAPDAVKEMADAVTAPVSEDGVAVAIERYVLNRP